MSRLSPTRIEAYKLSTGKIVATLEAAVQEQGVINKDTAIQVLVRLTLDGNCKSQMSAYQAAVLLESDVDLSAIQRAYKNATPDPGERIEP